jgi:alpha-D-ribose 1-methylphosphonate 5-triphosphate synthase subunit PhnG
VSDNITLPRAVVELVREAFTHVVCVYQDEKDMAALAALEDALAEPDAIARAVEAEREACAKIVYGLCISDNNAQEIVNAIRARGSHKA